LLNIFAILVIDPASQALMDLFGFIIHLIFLLCAFFYRTLIDLD